MTVIYMGSVERGTYTLGMEKVKFLECDTCAALLVHPDIDGGAAVRRHTEWHAKLNLDIAYAENPVIG